MANTQNLGEIDDASGIGIAKVNGAMVGKRHENQRIESNVS
jgi:hypothetical protein